MTEPKNILLTGATGFLGGYLAARLIKESDDNIFCLVRPRKRKNTAERLWSRIEEIITLGPEERNRVYIIEGDTSLPNLGVSESNASKIDEVWHCAAVLDFEHHKQDDTIQANKQGLLNVLSFMQRAKIHLINFVSTAYVAGKASGNISEEYYSHIAPVNNPYELSKRLCEELIVEWHAREGINYRIFRPSIIIGNSKTLDAESFSGLYGYLAILLRLKDSIELKMPDYFLHNPLKICTQPGASLNLICVDHVVDMMVPISQNAETTNKVFHLTNPYPNQITDSIELIGEAFGIEITPVWDRSTLGPIDTLLDAEEDIFRSYLDAHQFFECDKAYQLSGVSQSSVKLSKKQELQIFRNVKEKFDADKRVQRNRLKSVTHKFEANTLELIGKAPITYYSKGEGQALVILNAYGQSLSFWDKIADKFQAHYKTIIWSMRGTSSQKGGVDEVYPLSVHAEDIRQILDQESIEKCHLLAWCTGPKIALEFQSNYPERVASMVFLSSCFKGIDRFRDFHTTYENDMQEICSRVDLRPEIMPFVIETIKSNLSGTEQEAAYEELADEKKRNLVQEIVGLVGKDIKPMVIEPFLSVQSALNYARQLLLFWEKDIESLIRATEIPTLLVTGNEDNIASYKMSEAVSALSDTAQCATIKGGTHYLHYDNVDLLTSVVCKFLKEGHQFNFKHGLVKLQNIRDDVDQVEEPSENLPPPKPTINEISA